MEHSKKNLLENLLNDTSFQNWAHKKNRNDIAFWNNWIQENSDHIDTIYNARDIILGINFEKDTLSNDFVENQLNQVLNKITPAITQKEKSQNFKKSYFNTKTLVFPTIIVGLVAFYFLFNTFQSNEVIHKAGFGEIINLKLSDGTTVVLNGNSELKYNKENPRDVTLKGEAYFKVKSKPSTNAKFWVTTNDLKVEVFGTQFNVNTRNKKTNVLLDEGSVSLLLDNGNSEKMKPGEIISYSKNNEKFIHEKVSNKIKYAHWKDGTYIFNNVSLFEVMKYIENAYGIPSEFINSNSKNILITGGIPNENLKICLDAIQKSAGIKIKKNEHKLLIINN
jgi:ferric-dicitrate binding protein FerR (iron transport regulator)